MAVCVMGDIHFRDDKPYFVEVCERFLEWYSSWERNNPDNSIIFLGDLVERAVLSGRTASYLTKLIEYSKFKEIHIIVGNHDLKRQYGVEQLAYQMYEENPRVVIHSHAGAFDVEDLHILGLPHFNGLDDGGFSMLERYSGISKNRILKGPWDLVVGHICGEDVSFKGSDCIKNLDEVNTKKMILGHIHTRGCNPERYLGSVFAGRISENDSTRAVAIYENNEWKEEFLPLFNEFLEVYYPDPLPKSTALVPIYTVYNCTSEAIAKDTYGDIWVRSTSAGAKDMMSSKSMALDLQKGLTDQVDIAEMFKDFIATKKEVPEPVIDVCKRALGIQTNF